MPRAAKKDGNPSGPLRAAIDARDLEEIGRLLPSVLRATARDAAARRAWAEPLRTLARAELFARRFENAERLYRAALTFDPHDGSVHLALAQVHLAAGRKTEATACLRQTLRKGVRLTGGDRFKLLMRLRRFREALRAAETMLDRSPSLEDLRDFWDPWEWDERVTREERLEELRLLERAVGEKAGGAWLHYYRGSLSGPDRLKLFDPLASFSPARYGWMHFRAGMLALSAGRLDKAEAWLELALRCDAVDWRAFCFLAEVRLCLGRVTQALAAMTQAERAAPAGERGQVLAWRGAFDLWLGDYSGARTRLKKAAALGAQCAFCWLGAAELKLGHAEEALATLDRTLALYPLDFEAHVWRAEAKRALGRPQEALDDLKELERKDGEHATPTWLWARVNSALAKADLGDEAGMLADYDELPSYVVAYIHRKTGLEKPKDILEAGLKLSHGFRRDEYRQAIWMR